MPGSFVKTDEIAKKKYHPPFYCCTICNQIDIETDCSGIQAYLARYNRFLAKVFQLWVAHRMIFLSNQIKNPTSDKL